MLRIFGERDRRCDGVTRRSFLEAGVLGVGGLALGDYFRIAEGQGGRSVILFWLSGGPGHMETWDPKPEAPDRYRGPFGAIGTNVPGIQFCELMPELARSMDRLAILRSVNHGSGDHTKGNHWMLTGFEGPAFNAPDFRHQRRPAMGSVVAKLREGERSDLPSYAAVPHLKGGTDNFFHYAAYLGGGSNPFVVESDPNEEKYRVKNLSLPGGLSFERLGDRRQLFERLEGLRRQGEAGPRDMDAHQRQAMEVLTSRRVAEAYDIGRESEATRDRYGRHTFGQSALLARRLVEAGTPFVTVNCVPWDHHGTPPQMKTEEGARKLIPPLDRAIGALIEDLVARGLFDRTMVVAMGEFGRTPKMNKDAGRDHWGRAFSVLMACGSMRMGQVIGRSDARGESVADRPVGPEDVTATVYHHLGIDARELSFPGYDGRPLRVVERGEPIRELIG